MINVVYQPFYLIHGKVPLTGFVQLIKLYYHQGSCITQLVMVHALPVCNGETGRAAAMQA